MTEYVSIDINVDFDKMKLIGRGYVKVERNYKITLANFVSPNDGSGGGDHGGDGK